MKQLFAGLLKVYKINAKSFLYTLDGIFKKRTS